MKSRSNHRDGRSEHGSRGKNIATRSPLLLIAILVFSGIDQLKPTPHLHFLWGRRIAGSRARPCPAESAAPPAPAATLPEVATKPEKVPGREGKVAGRSGITGRGGADTKRNNNTIQQ